MRTIGLWSADLHKIEQLQRADRWQESGEMLGRAARRLEQAGAEFLVLCSNTMHKVAAQIEVAVRIPLLHIADATAERIREAGLSRVALLGSCFTMEPEFYRGRLQEKHALEVLPRPRAIGKSFIGSSTKSCASDVCSKGPGPSTGGCSRTGSSGEPGG